MLKFFKTYFALIPLLFILVLMMSLRINIIINEYYIDLWQGNISPFSKLLVKLLGRELITNPIFNSIISAIIIFIQSSLIISIFSFFKNKDLKSFLPAWLFVLLMHLNPNLVFLSPQLISLLFVLWSFKKLIYLTEVKKSNNKIFDIGILMGIATMFWAPTVFYVLFVLFYLNQNAKLSLKVFISLILSFLIPLIYVGASFIFTGNNKFLIESFDNVTINNFKVDMYDKNQLLSSFYILFISMLSIAFTLKFLDKQLREIKNIFMLLWFFIFNTILLYVFQNENTISIIIFLLFPFSVFISVLFNKIKRKVLAEFLHLILLLTIIINFIYFTRV